MLALHRKSVVVVYVRHRSTCPHRELESYPRCDCPKWLRYSVRGKQHRESAGTRAWSIAEARAQEKQKQLDSGEVGTAPTPQAAQPTIEQAAKTFITGKEGEGVGPSTIRKLKHQLGAFESFMTARSKFYASEITTQDIIEYRASWSSWKSGVTRQKAQSYLRTFIRYACRGDYREALLDALGKPVRLTREDKERLKPKPFTEAELKKLLAAVPKTFPDKISAARMTALIHFMVSTGVAIRDTIQLQRKNISDQGWLKIERQKTGKAVMQKLDPALHRELLAVLNGNPRYFFWSGDSLASSATTNWQHDLRTLMTDAGVWIKGNLSHRFRDTAVDFWLGVGCSMNEIAASLGDTVAIVEKHYADLASKRMEERLAKMPVRSWGEAGHERV
jgi:integrase